MQAAMVTQLGVYLSETIGAVRSYLGKRCAELGVVPDPDRPEGSLVVGQSETVNGLEVTVTKFGPVRPTDPLQGFDYVGAYVRFKNLSNEPREVVADAQMRLENPYIAEVRPTGPPIKDGRPVPIGAIRPGATVQGWVVWAVPDTSDLLKSVGIYYLDDLGDEAVWWHSQAD
jgi:hypothetical protein